MTKHSLAAGPLLLLCSLLAQCLLAAPAEARAYTILHTFKNGDGIRPNGALVADQSGNLYGTTRNTVFKLAPDGTETVLHSFSGYPYDGQTALAGLIMGSDGNLYGTTEEGGDGNGCADSGCGTVFEITTDGKETILHSFDAGDGDGYYPVGKLTQDAAGSLYGTTYFGGDDQGVVFKLTSVGLTILHSFNRAHDGCNPNAGVLLDTSGNLYGTTYFGGADVSDCNFNGRGTVFKVAADGSETILHSFAKTPDGANPAGGLMMDAAGNLFGTTFAGGNGSGTVFEIAPDGTETLVHTFAGPDGSEPESALIADSQGNLFGTTFAGGQHALGTVFELTPQGDQSVLYSFRSRQGGNSPKGDLTINVDGALVGAAPLGGARGENCHKQGCGTIFALSR
jgi:uncharacterized repeat protein (TIGR03803 family)